MSCNSSTEWLAQLKQSTRFPDGFRTACCTIDFFPKERPTQKPYPMKMSLVVADQPCESFALAFTRNAFPGAPVRVGKTRIGVKALQALLVNTKVSNVGGPRGIEDAEALCAEVAALIKVDANTVLPSSTGIIGWSLPLDEMKSALPGLHRNLGSSDLADFAQNIMTTDSWPKAVTVPVGEGCISAVAKGAGMIEPNLATMLVFIFTDLAQDRESLRRSLSSVIEKTFNCISVDSDQSTSDTCVLLSSARKPAVAEAEFESALEAVCGRLAQWVVRNGEGTSHVIRVKTMGFGEHSRSVGKAVVNSPLVKTAIYGNDPNVGRILSSAGDFLGNAGVSIDSAKLRLEIGGIEVFSRGAFRLDHEKEKELSALFSNCAQDPEKKFPQHERCVELCLSLEGGTGVAEVLGSDLGHEYVTENADYRS